MDDFLIHWHSQIMDIDRIPFVVAAIFVTIVTGMILGPMAGNANPFFWTLFDKILGGIGDRLDKRHRPQADLLFRGFLLCVFSVFLAVSVGKGFSYASTHYAFHGVSEIFFLTLLITSGAVWFSLLRLYFAMEQNNVNKGAYYAIARSTRINLSTSDDCGITRAGMGFAARSFDKGLVAPILWYLILGFPGALAYTALAALAWRFGKDGFTKGFGAVPLALEKLMGFVPSLFAALLITAASLFTPTAKLHKGLAAWLGNENRAPYEQGGFPLSALAWSLNVSLGGAGRDLSGSAIKGIWVGPRDATAQNNHKHLRRAIYINVMAHILLMASLLGAYLLGQ